MHRQQICIITTLYSTLLLNVDGENWYSASITELYHTINNNESAKNYRPNNLPDEEHKYLPFAPLDNESDLINFEKPNKNIVQVEKVRSNVTYATNDGVKRTKTIKQHSDRTSLKQEKEISSYERLDQHGNKSLTTSSKRNVSYNNTIHNFNVFRSLQKNRKCPVVRRRKKKQLKGRQRNKSRFLEVFQVVEFAHAACTSSSGLEGKCLHEYECKSSGGATMGDCADGYGTCCVMQVSCGDLTDTPISWFTNPGFPSPSTERLSCAISVNLASSDIKQIRLDFTAFELQPPNYGTCEQDQFVVSGQNINSFIPILCGVNNGQHVYIEVGDVEGPVYLSIQTVTSDSRLFAIKMTQLTSFDSLAAPTGCLQYFKDTQGYLESFNYQDSSIIAIARNPSYLNNLNYAMCIKRGPEMCTISYTNVGEMQIINYDIDGLPVIPPGQAGVEIFNCPTDWLLTAAARLCGERLNDGSVLQDFSLDAPITDVAAGPIIVWFKSDAAVTGRGFRLEYQQNLCTSSV